MAYTRSTWVQNTTIVSASKMNNIESGVAAVDAAVTEVAGQMATMVAQAPDGSTSPVSNPLIVVGTTPASAPAGATVYLTTGV